MLFPAAGSATALYDNPLIFNNLAGACGVPSDAYFGMGIYALFGPSHVRAKVLESSLTANGKALPHCAADPTNVPYSHFIDRGAVVIVPHDQLEPNTTYEVSITTEPHGTVEWTFRSGDNHAGE